MLKEFRNFIMTGNVVEFAVAVIMAGAIGAVINGFVSKIAMPLIGLVSGGVSFSDKFWTPGDTVYKTVEEAKEANRAWMGDLWTDFVADVASRREMTSDDILAYINSYKESMSEYKGDAHENNPNNCQYFRIMRMIPFFSTLNN